MASSAIHPVVRIIDQGAGRVLPVGTRHPAKLHNMDHQFYSALGERRK